MKETVPIINNKNIVVIGGSSGIGKQLIEKLYKNNKIVSISRNIEDSENKYLSIKSDISDINEITDALEQAIKFLNTVDIFVITAASSTIKNFNEISEQDIINLVSTNIIGTTFSIKKIINHMIHNNKGVILCTSSISSLYSFKMNALYAASKAFLNKLIRDISEEIKEYNIRINCVAPGLVDTLFINKTNINNEDVTNSILSNKKIPVENVVDVFLYLMSENSKYINGSTIEVNI